MMTADDRMKRLIRNKHALLRKMDKASNYGCQTIEDADDTDSFKQDRRLLERIEDRLAYLRQHRQTQTTL